MRYERVTRKYFGHHSTSSSALVRSTRDAAARLYAVRFDSSSRCHLALISRADAEALRRTAARNPSTLTFIRAVLARSLTALCASSLLYELYPADGID